MKEAPQGGYARELVLDREAIKKLFAKAAETRAPEPVYFYIKAFEKYGKGRLEHLKAYKEPWGERGKRQAEPRFSAGLQILMQPDGSRNLEGYE